MKAGKKKTEKQKNGKNKEKTKYKIVDLCSYISIFTLNTVV